MPIHSNIIVVSLSSKKSMEKLFSSEVLCVLEPNEQPVSTSSSKANSPTKYFSTITKNEIQASITSRIFINTRKNTTWSHNVRKEWCQERNIDEELIPTEEKTINKLMSQLFAKLNKKMETRTHLLLL